MTETADRPFPQYKRFLPGGTSSWGVMHAFNRTAGGLFLFGPDEKEHFRSLVFGAAHFCGLEVLTWTCLDNHFHLVLNVPSEAEGARLRAEVSEEEIFARMEKCYSQAYLKETKQRLKKFRSTPGKEALAENNPTIIPLDCSLTSSAGSSHLCDVSGPLAAARAGKCAVRSRPPAFRREIGITKHASTTKQNLEDTETKSKPLSGLGPGLDAVGWTFCPPENHQMPNGRPELFNSATRKLFKTTIKLRLTSNCIYEHACPPSTAPASPLWQVVHHAWPRFLRDYESLHRKIHFVRRQARGHRLEVTKVSSLKPKS